MSRKNKFALYGGVSALALAVALGGSAYANAPPPEGATPQVQGGSAAAGASYLDGPLVELMLRSQGRLTAQSVAALLPSIIGPLTIEKAETLPYLMKSIRSLGVGADVQIAALGTLTGLIAEASGTAFDDAAAAKLMADVSDQQAVEMQVAMLRRQPGGGNDGHGNGGNGLGSRNGDSPGHDRQDNNKSHWHKERGVLGYTG